MFNFQAGVGFDKMKRYGSKMRSVHGISISEVLQEMWKKSNKLYNVGETRDGHHRAPPRTPRKPMR